MKPTLLFTALSLVLTTPTLLAKSELETLRALCKEQERQIHLLEDENAKLRSIEPPSRSKASTETPVSKPVGKAEIAKAAEPAPAAASATTYTVKAGDSFGKIARKVGTTPEKLAKANGLKITAMIRPGQKLKVPGTTAPATVVASKSASTPAAPAPVASSSKTHKVMEGETFYSISRKHGISTEKLIAANPTVKPSALRPGQMVSLVSNSSATTTIAAERTSNESRSAPAPVAKVPAAAPRNIPVSTPPPAPAPAATTPAPDSAPAAVAEKESAPVDNGTQKKIHAVTIDGEMTYGEFATNHGTNTERLNALNGLDLTNATVLARGSELYVPAQP